MTVLCLVEEAGGEVGLAGELPASAVVAAGTDRGNEVLAHLGAITGLPVAAQCVSAAADGPGRWRLVRHRWAGSLLEDAELQAPVAVLTVAPDAVAAEPAATPADTTVHRHEPSVAGADLVVRAAESAGPGAEVSLATARVVVGGGRGVGGPEGFGPLEELAGLLGGVVGVSRVVTSEGWRPHKQQVGQTGTRISPSCTWPAGSAARSSTWPGACPPGTSWRSTPTPRRRSSTAPTTR